MAKVLDHFENIEDNEVVYLRTLMEDLDDKTAAEFAVLYKKRRRNPNTVLVLVLLGFLGLAGLHRFYMHKVGTGLLYFVTLGFVGLGTIYDLATYRKAAYEYNKFAAQRVDIVVRDEI